jgi:hypothetical protein
MKNVAIIALLRAREEFIEQKNAAVRRAAKPFDDKIADIDAAIAKIDDKELPQPLSKPAYTGAKRGRKPKVIHSLAYPFNGSVLTKLLYVIKDAGRFVNIREIAGMVKTFEPNVNEEIIKLRFGKHIDKYKKLGRIVSYQVGTKRNTVYGFPQWLKDGKVLSGREHNNDTLIDPVPIEENEVDRILNEADKLESKGIDLALYAASDIFINTANRQ